MRIIQVRPLLNPHILIVKGDLFLDSAIEDPALRPYDEVESDYDGLLQIHGLFGVADAICRSL